MRYSGNSNYMSTAFSVKVRDFEGPLDLLLDLIEDRKMLVTDVSLSKVADDFISFIQTQGGFPLGQATNFVYVSATLLLLKSRSLLPVLTLSDEEEGDVKDLEFRLRLYQLFRSIAKTFPNGNARIFFGAGAGITEPIFLPSKDLSLETIAEAMDRVLAQVPQKVKNQEVSVKTVISLEDMIDRLSLRIEKAIQMTFKDFSGSAEDKREIVVGFLAMLELVKRGLVLVNQERQFGDIHMNYGGKIGAPAYD